MTVLTRGRRPLPQGHEGLGHLIADRADPAALRTALAGRRFDATVDLLAFDAGDVARLHDALGEGIGRHLMISSGQVYLVAAERHPPFREEDAAREPSPEPAAGTRDHGEWRYGIGKRAAEAELLARTGGRPERGVCLRLPVVQGARDRSRRLWAYLERLRDGGPILLPGGAAPVRFVWAEDVARALVTLAESAPPSPAYNLAMPDEPPLDALLERAAEHLGTRARLVSCRWDDVRAAALGPGVSPYSGPWCSRPDPARAEREWGFRGAPSDAWLPQVIAAHLAEPSPASHPGYADRAAELALAARLGAA